MINIWTNLLDLPQKNQMLAVQVRTILKNGWFSGLGIREIHQLIYWQTYQQIPNTVTEAVNTGKPESQTKPNDNDNGRNTENTTTQTLTQEEKK